MNLRTGPGLAALLTFPRIGVKRAQALAERFDTWDVLADATVAELAAVVGESAAVSLAMLRDVGPPALDLPDGVAVVSVYDPQYPQRLLGIPNRPPLLWYRGTLPPQDVPAVAVVGTRQPTVYGKTVTRLVSEQAAERGIVHVSGLAFGVDLLSHLACMDAGAPTWAVLGQGVDAVEEGTARADAARRILSTGGGLIAEVPLGTRAVAHTLVARNRLQSGLSDATVIAQSGLPGSLGPAGTMQTARFAIEQRRLLAVPRPSGKWADEPRSAGNMALTDPAGCDPDVLHATDPATITIIRARTPVADIVVNSREDLPGLWDAITRHARN